ncbi:MAG: class I SAM-dependent methyltransferase [Crocinitomicaceae bacterium]
MRDRSKSAVHLFNKYAEKYSSKFKNLENYHDGFNFLCSHLPKKSSLLDMACGPGNISNYLLSVRPDFKILGIDLAPKMIEIAKTSNENADFKLGDIREIHSLNQTFNAIVLGFGLPYLSKEYAKQVIKYAHACLTKNGLIYISTMEGKYSDSGYQKSSDGKDEMFIYKHKPEYIQRFLKSVGFEIIWEKHQPYFEGEVLRFTDYIVIAKKS